jgi:hypothetical protein
MTARLTIPPTPRQIPRVQPPLPPYALSAPTFPFRHLAGLAGRAPIGGAREVALACFVAVRLAADCVAHSPDIPETGRSARSVGAKGWLGTLALPAAVRGPLLRCVESTADGTADSVGREVVELAAAVAVYLDAGSRAELEALAAALRG